jgi:hypothetical protein
MHRDELMMRRGKESSFAHPAFENGTRPAGWWDYENKSNEPRKRQKAPSRFELDTAESELRYLERTGQLFADEKRLAIKAAEDKQRRLKSISRATDLDELRDSPEVFHY